MKELIMLIMEQNLNLFVEVFVVLVLCFATAQVRTVLW